MLKQVPAESVSEGWEPGRSGLNQHYVVASCECAVMLSNISAAKYHRIDSPGIKYSDACNLLVTCLTHWQHGQIFLDAAHDTFMQHINCCSRIV